MVPDQRGYNRSDKPEGVDAYRMERLAGDVVALIQETGKLRAVLVGHDWGAAVAWWVALTHPEVVERLVIMNVPHPKVMRETLQQSWSQRLKSWYILFFQLPWLPEVLLRMGNYRGLANALQSSSREGTFSREDLLRYRKAWGRKGGLTAMLNWYRGVRLAWGQEIPHHGIISVETFMIWGDQDRFLGQEMAEPSIQLCSNGRLVHFPDATHWIQHEEAERVNDLILSFVRSADRL
jgi:pimeloyl-ACP methyl ester carboxylesterase